MRHLRLSPRVVSNQETIMLPMEGTRTLSFVSSTPPFSTARSNLPLAYNKSPPQFFSLLTSNSNVPSPLKSLKKPHKRTERNPTPRTPKLNSEVSPHRAASVVRLLRIEQGGAFADLLNDKCGDNGEGEMGYVQRTLGFRTRALDDRDIRLVTDIVGGTVRWRRYLDHLIMSLCIEERMFRDMEPLLLQILRIGFYEIIKLNMPSYAVVDENVKLAKTALKPGAGNLVNVIMRKLLLLKVPYERSTVLYEFLRIQTGMQTVIQAGLLKEGMCYVQDESAGWFFSLILDFYSNAD